MTDPITDLQRRFGHLIISTRELFSNRRDDLYLEMNPDHYGEPPPTVEFTEKDDG